METVLDSSLTYETTNKGYAGFWLRFVAAIIDGIIFSIPYYSIMFIIGFSNASNPEAIGGASMFLGLGSIILQWLYFALMESSSKQATLGKIALGLKVTDIQGGKISFGQATGRFFGKFVSSIILAIGYIMAGFTAKKQALHDIMANTLVVIK